MKRGDDTWDREACPGKGAEIAKADGTAALYVTYMQVAAQLWQTAIAGYASLHRPPQAKCYLAGQ